MLFGMETKVIQSRLLTASRIFNEDNLPADTSTVKI